MPDKPRKCRCSFLRDDSQQQIGHALGDVLGSCLQGTRVAPRGRKVRPTVGGVLGRQRGGQVAPAHLDRRHAEEEARQFERPSRVPDSRRRRSLPGGAGPRTAWRTGAGAGGGCHGREARPGESPPGRRRGRARSRDMRSSRPCTFQLTGSGLVGSARVPAADPWTADSSASGSGVPRRPCVLTQRAPHRTPTG